MDNFWTPWVSSQGPKNPSYLSPLFCSMPFMPLEQTWAWYWVFGYHLYRFTGAPIGTWMGYRGFSQGLFWTLHSFLCIPSTHSLPLCFILPVLTVHTCVPIRAWSRVVQVASPIYWFTELFLGTLSPLTPPMDHGQFCLVGPPWASCPLSALRNLTSHCHPVHSSLGSKN